MVNSNFFNAQQCCSVVFSTVGHNLFLNYSKVGVGKKIWICVLRDLTIEISIVFHQTEVSARFFFFKLFAYKWNRMGDVLRNPAQNANSFFFKGFRYVGSYAIAKAGIMIVNPSSLVLISIPMIFESGRAHVQSSINNNEDSIQT